MANLDLSGIITRICADLKTKFSKVTFRKYAAGDFDITVDGTSYSITLPAPAVQSPHMDGTVAVGTLTTYARADHVHPTDTSRQETLVSGTNIKTINGTSLLGSGNISITGLVNGILAVSAGGTGQTGRSDGTITRNTTNCSTLGTSWISHNGVTCTVSFIDAKITNALANNGNVVVATLPEGFRPRANMYVSCIEKAGLWARITASGEVRISNRTGASYAAGSTFTFSTSYDI